MQWVGLELEGQVPYPAEPGSCSLPASLSHPSFSGQNLEESTPPK